MSEQDDLQDQDGLEDDLDSDAETTESDSGSDESAPPADDNSEEEFKKRNNDLMSKWQAAEARAKKAEKALEAQQAKAKATSTSRKSASDRNSAADEFIQFTRENARKTLFEADPRFAKYGLSLDAITGETLDDMKDAAKAQAKLIDAIESKTRNEILSEHGLQPAVETGATSEGAKSFNEMTDKEFAEFLVERDQRLR